MLKTFEESPLFRDALFRNYSSVRSDIGVLDRLVFESIAASVVELPSAGLPNALSFDQLPPSYQKVPIRKSTLGKKLKELKTAGCNERLIVLYAYWLASTQNVGWKKRILPFAPDVKSLEQAAATLRSLVQVPILRPETLTDRKFKTETVEQAAEVLELYSQLIKACLDALDRFSSKNYLRDHVILILGNHIKERTGQSPPWELIAALIGCINNKDVPADNLRKTFERAASSLPDKSPK